MALPAANGHHSILAYRRVLAPNGRYVCSGGSMTQVFQGLLLGPLLSAFGSKKLSTMAAAANSRDLTQIKELVENGKIRPVIDRMYPLNEAAEAFRYLGEGHAHGKVLIKIE